MEVADTDAPRGFKPTSSQPQISFSAHAHRSLPVDSTSKRELLVSKIENGIVIDHIPAGKAFQVLRLLKVEPDARVIIAQNVDSKTMSTEGPNQGRGNLPHKQTDRPHRLPRPRRHPKHHTGLGREGEEADTAPEAGRGYIQVPQSPLPDERSLYSTFKTIFKVEKGERIEETKTQLHILRKHNLLRSRPRAADKGRLHISRGAASSARRRLSVSYSTPSSRAAPSGSHPHPRSPSSLRAGARVPTS